MQKPPHLTLYFVRRYGITFLDQNIFRWLESHGFSHDEALLIVGVERSDIDESEFYNVLSFLTEDCQEVMRTLNDDVRSRLVKLLTENGLALGTPHTQTLYRECVRDGDNYVDDLPEDKEAFEQGCAYFPPDEFIAARHDLQIANLLRNCSNMIALLDEAEVLMAAHRAHTGQAPSYAMSFPTGIRRDLEDRLEALLAVPPASPSS